MHMTGAWLLRDIISLSKSDPSWVLVEDTNVIPMLVRKRGQPIHQGVGFLILFYDKTLTSYYKQHERKKGKKTLWTSYLLENIRVNKKVRDPAMDLNF